MWHGDFSFAALPSCLAAAPLPDLPVYLQVSRKEMQATLALRFGGEGILKVKGIPFKAGASDVRKFFSSYKIKPDGVSFIMHADGRPTGMAFIEFETPQEAVRAMVSPPLIVWSFNCRSFVVFFLGLELFLGWKRSCLPTAPRGGGEKLTGHPFVA